VAVERRYRGPPALSGQPVPHVLAARTDTWTGDPAKPGPAEVADRQAVTA
jgi:hypothetical protein